MDDSEGGPLVSGPRETAAERNHKPGLHKGLYFRVGLGFGRAIAREKVDGSSKVDLTGWTLPSFEIAIGGWAIPGLALGVGLYDANFTPLISNSEGRDRDRAAFLHSVGPFFDLYPNPSVGYHVQASVTYGSISLGSNEVALACMTADPSVPCALSEHVDYGGDGVGLTGGVGYEGWILPRLNLGALVRVQYFAATLRSDDGAHPNAYISLWVPALLLTVTH